MRRGTTPTFTLTVTGEAFDECTVYVTVKQGVTVITKSGDDLTITPTETGSTIEMTLTQAETLSLEDGTAGVQIAWIDAAGTACRSAVVAVPVTQALLNEEITYDQG